MFNINKFLRNDETDWADWTDLLLAQPLHRAEGTISSISHNQKNLLNLFNHREAVCSFSPPLQLYSRTLTFRFTKIDVKEKPIQCFIRRQSPSFDTSTFSSPVGQSSSIFHIEAFVFSIQHAPAGRLNRFSRFTRLMMESPSRLSSPSDEWCEWFSSLLFEFVLCCYPLFPQGTKVGVAHGKRSVHFANDVSISVGRSVNSANRHSAMCIEYE